MDEDVVWRRDIYRELDLNNEANAALYYPVEPKGNQMNLFTTIFRLMMTGKITVFQYRMDGNESFSAADRVDPKSFLDNYHIYYEKQANGRIKLDNSDIPSREVKSYYIKESSFFDQRSSNFHSTERQLNTYSSGTAAYVQNRISATQFCYISTPLGTSPGFCPML